MWCDCYSVGKSLGTAVAINLAYEIITQLKQSPAGLVLISPFMSLVQIVGSKIKFAKADLYDSSKKTDKLTIPIFGSHGQSDEVIDMKFSKKTVSKFPNVWKFLELDCGHHDIDYSDDLMDELISFIDFVGKNIDGYTPHVVKKIEIPCNIIIKYIYLFFINFFFFYKIAQYQRGLTVDNWLDSLGLGKYSQQFLINGYFSMDVVKMLQKVDLQAMEINNENDQQKILTAVNSLVLNVQPKPNITVEKTTSNGSSTVKIEPIESKEKREIEYGPMEINSEAFSKILEDHSIDTSNSGI